MNLIQDPWIPVATTTGETLIRPADICRSDVITLAAPRPDFDGALVQFLIGVLQTGYPPDDDSDWFKQLQNAPSPEALHSRLERLAPAFNLDGDGPKFMQDFEELDGESKPVAALLIDAPGAQSIRFNKDHFIKRGSVTCLCQPCTATALLTLQTNAPSGGAGHRTSLRGGGPLTTIVSSTSEAGMQSLWQQCWLNVMPQQAIASMTGNASPSGPEKVFPWLTTTHTSEKGKSTTPLDTSPLQMYWAMPRRIKLLWQKVINSHCDICGVDSKTVCTEYLTKNYGVNYEGAWVHPLSPYQKNTDGVPLPLHPQQGGMQYRHWLGLVSGSDARLPATIVSRFTEGTARQLVRDRSLRLHSFGFDMDNMKPCCWYEATFPIITVDTDIRAEFSEAVEEFIEAATLSASYLRSCVKDAWFKRPGDAKGDTNFIQEAFFSSTESEFFDALEQLKQALSQKKGDQAVRHYWHDVISKQALDLFLYWTSRGDFEAANPKRIALAHKKLSKLMYGNKLTKNILNIQNHREEIA